MLKSFFFNKKKKIFKKVLAIGNLNGIIVVESGRKWH